MGQKTAWIAGQFLFALFLSALSQLAVAVDFRSVEPAVAILYDAPSTAAKKRYLVKAFTPLEVLVLVKGWSKVRDADGAISWIENKALSNKRTLVVSAARAEIRREANEKSAILLELDQFVAVEILDSSDRAWIKVKHPEGVVGFIRATQVWGL